MIGRSSSTPRSARRSGRVWSAPTSWRRACARPASNSAGPRSRRRDSNRKGGGSKPPLPSSQSRTSPPAREEFPRAPIPAGWVVERQPGLGRSRTLLQLEKGFSVTAGYVGGIARSRARATGPELVHPASGYKRSRPLTAVSCVYDLVEGTAHDEEVR